MEPRMTVAAKKPQRAKITGGKRAGRATGAVPESPKVKSWGPTPAACAVTPAAECEATGTQGLLHYLLKYVQLQGCSFESPSSSRLHSKSLGSRACPQSLWSSELPIPNQKNRKQNKAQKTKNK